MKSKFLKIPRWFFLGIGYICYLVYVTLRYIFFSVGFTIIGLFQFILNVLTFKHVRSLIKKDEPSTKMNKKEAKLAKLNKKKNNEIIDLNQEKRNNEIVDLNQGKKNNEIIDLNQEKRNDEVIDLNSKILERKKEDTKRIKNEDKIFKDVDVKQSFKERLGIAFPTLFSKREDNEYEPVKDDGVDYIEHSIKDDEQDRTKTVYEYTARNKKGKLEKNYIEAYSLVEVQSYLLSEGYDIYRIRTNQSINIFHRTAIGKKKMKTSDLVFFLTQLSTYIKAGITLTESVDILSRQFKDKYYKKVFKNVANSLKSGDNFSEALTKTGNVFPKLLINMVKTAELTGDLPETLDDMADYYSEMDKTRKQMKSALTYPTIVLVLSIAVIAFVLIYVIPKFTSIYESMNNASIPKLTLVIISISDFIKSNYYYIAIAFILLLLLIKYLYSNVISSRAIIQKIAMHIPVLKDVIIYNEVTTFTKTFSSLLKHGVFITDTMNILLQITNNEIYKKLIYNCMNYLNKGESISIAFKGHWAFPVPAYEMIVTGERTGKLPEMLAKVSEYYQDLHANIVSRMKVIIEPVLIIMLTGIVGLIILAVIVPMFGIYSSIQ